MLTGHMLSGSRSLWLLVVMSLAVIGFTEGCGDPESENVGTRADVLQSEYLLGFETSPAGLRVIGGFIHSGLFETQYQMEFMSPDGAVVEIDNVSHTMPFSFWCDEGTTHTAHFPSPQLIAPNTRYVFQFWTHPDFLGNPATFVCDSEKSTSVVVAIQHYVTVETLPDANLEIRIDSISYAAPQSFWWDQGAVHDLDVTSPQVVDWTTAYFWKSWSDGGEKSHLVTIASPATYAATFVIMHMVNITTSPIGLQIEVNGIIHTTPYIFWSEEGSEFEVCAPNPPMGIVFSHWSDGGDQCHTVTVTGPLTLNAFYILGYEVTVDTSPWVPIVEVDGVDYEPPATFGWELNSNHTICAPSPQMTLNGTRFFSHWSDGGARCHAITANQSATYTAYFTGTVQVTIDTLPTFQEILVDGTPYITPKLFYWDLGSVHTVEAHELIAVGQNASLRFSHWSDGGNRSHTVVIEDSGAFVAYYDKYYRIVVDTVPRGLNISVDGQNVTSLAVFWWKEGSMHSLVPLTPQELNRTRYIFIMWGDGNYPPNRVLLVREPWTCIAIYKPIRGISAVIPPELEGYSGIKQDWPSEPGPGGDYRMARWERERILPGP